jgi:hypothetical protein
MRSAGAGLGEDVAHVVLMVAWPRMRLAAISSSFREISVRPVQAEEGVQSTTVEAV